MFVGKGTFPPSPTDVNPFASKEAKNEAEESGPDVLPLKPRAEDASEESLGHQFINHSIAGFITSCCRCWLVHWHIMSFPMLSPLSHCSQLWRDLAGFSLQVLHIKMHYSNICSTFRQFITSYNWHLIISHRWFQGARMSVSSASGKHSAATATKKPTAMGPPTWPRSHDPRMEMWMRLKANILLPTSRLLATTKQHMVGPQPIFPGNPKTAESILSRLAKLSPALKHEMPMETAMLTKSALENSMDAMLWMPTMKDIKKLLCTNAEIADSATFRETMHVYANDSYYTDLPVKMHPRACRIDIPPTWSNWILHVSNICQFDPVFSYSFRISAR